MRFESTHGKVVERGHEDHGRHRHVAKSSKDIETVELGHLNVEKEQIWTQGTQEMERLAPIACFSDDVDVALRGEELADAASRQGLVVRDYRANVHPGKHCFLASVATVRSQ